MLNDSDDDDFSSSFASKSNLAHLFSNKVTKGLDSSLIYNAPKQPRKQATETSSLLCAKVVTIVEGLKEDSTNAKYGLAIVGNESLKTYELILYRTKQNILSRTKISSSFNFSIQDYVFGSFSDRTRQWVVKFKDRNDVSDFCDKLNNTGAGIIRTNTEAHRAISSNEPVQRQSPDIQKGPILKIETEKDRYEENDFTTNISSKIREFSSGISKIGVPVLPRASPAIPCTDINSKQFNDSQLISKSSDDIVQIEDTKISSANNLNIQLNVSEPPQNQFVQNVHFSNSQILSVPDPINLLAAETRIANCETKLSLAQIQSKLDQLLQSANNLPEPQSKVLQSKNKALQLKIDNLEAEIGKLKTENVKLHCNYNESGANPQFIETLEIENQELKNKILNYEVDVLNAKKEIELCHEERSNTSRLIEQNQNLLEDNVKLQNKIKEYEGQLKELNKLRHTTIELKESIEIKEQQLLECKHELECFNPEGDRVNKMEKMKILEREIKDIMNDMYQTIISSGNSVKYPISEEFKLILVKLVKNSTFKIIEEIQKKFA
ncbi:uncharacterized protein LOC108741599 [Agrilus planipennis]|uniref:Uncharacterized protein LOC108741599 n=1 Tax=Agrilus planipennis TaxID=224129 RepID=A0A1W4XGP0_AGRPL|nr:uncharacterized protein LOC108741599 [Agrilus planipennis]